MPKVKVDVPGMAKDARVEVPMLGVFKNRSTTEVSDAAWQRWVAHGGAGAARYHSEDEVEFSGEEAARATEAHRALVEATGRAPRRPTPVAEVPEGGLQRRAPGERPETPGGPPEPTALDKRKKDELVELATAAGMDDASSKNKDELVEYLENREV
jgi:hypothetical protein